jgi:hypothetical protein
MPYLTQEHFMNTVLESDDKKTYHSPEITSLGFDLSEGKTLSAVEAGPLGTAS